VDVKKVITYGTFDLLHYGHVSLLKRAKELGDYLIVGVTSDSYDKERGKMNVKQSVVERIENVKSTGLADLIIVEEFSGQKIIDIQKYGVDTFVVGSDWTGKFEYLREFCNVVYLERTRGISSTELRSKDSTIINIGIIGSGRIAHRFVAEAKYVSGVNVDGVYNPHIKSAQDFMDSNELAFATDNAEEFFDRVNAVYIASPHATHFDYIKQALEHGKHVLCEKPMVLTESEAKQAYDLAREKGLVLMEAIKTAYCPCFEHLRVIAKGGKIGLIKDVEATFTKLVNRGRELDESMAGGAINELGSYVFMPIIKLLGSNYKKADFYSYKRGGVDLFTKGMILFPNATASVKVGLGVKSEGELIISGTTGYIYVPAPWWKTEYFEVRYENTSSTEKYFYKFEGGGLRYELADFVNLINSEDKTNRKLTKEESVAIAGLIEKYHTSQCEEF
jgi:glycerol-3-phosphate cytidylyltransferase